MALAYDASSQGAYDGTSPFSWTHTPVGTPRGVLVGTTEHATLSDDITAVTYGGVAMTKVGGITTDASEDGTATAWFLGSGIPTGAQTVEVTHNVAGGVIRGYCVTVTASTGTRLAGTTGFATSTTTTNPSVTVTGIAGASYGFGVLFSGQNDPASITAGSGMTMRQTYDEEFGGVTSGAVESSTSENASGNLTIAFTQSADEAALIGVAIEEIPASTLRLLTLTGVGK